MTTIQPPKIGNWALAVHSLAWQRLSAAQQLWVAVFIATNDAKEATRRAYPKVRSKPKSIQVMSWETLKSPRVRAVLDLYQGHGDREQLLECVKAHLDKADPGSVAAQRLLSQWERLTVGSSDSEDAPPTGEPAPDDGIQRFAVGEVIKQGGKRYRIEAVEMIDIEVR